jgi:hypothetical protein
MDCRKEQSVLTISRKGLQILMAFNFCWLDTNKYFTLTLNL